VPSGADSPLRGVSPSGWLSWRQAGKLESASGLSNGLAACPPASGSMPRLESPLAGWLRLPGSSRPPPSYASRLGIIKLNERHVSADEQLKEVEKIDDAPGPRATGERGALVQCVFGLRCSSSACGLQAAPVLPLEAARTAAQGRPSLPAASLVIYCLAKVADFLFFGYSQLVMTSSPPPPKQRS